MDPDVLLFNNNILSASSLDHACRTSDGVSRTALKLLLPMLLQMQGTIVDDELNRPTICQDVMIPPGIFPLTLRTDVCYSLRVMM